MHRIKSKEWHFLHPFQSENVLRMTENRLNKIEDSQFWSFILKYFILNKIKKVIVTFYLEFTSCNSEKKKEKKKNPGNIVKFFTIFFNLKQLFFYVNI